MIKKRRLPITRGIIILVAAVLLSTGSYLVTSSFLEVQGIIGIEPTPKQYPSPSWRGLQPGVTTIEQALKIMNEPDEIVDVGEFTIYRFDRDQPAWNLLELWSKTEEGLDSPILAIYRTIPGMGMTALEPSDILPLIWEYGNPNFVGWGDIQFIRFFIWSNRGVVVDVSARLDLFGWRELGYGRIWIFEPMSLEEFFATPWPLPIPGVGFPRENQYPDGDRPDVYPRDPYDWEHVPTPPP